MLYFACCKYMRKHKRQFDVDSEFAHGVVKGVVELLNVVEHGFERSYFALEGFRLVVGYAFDVAFERICRDICESNRCVGFHVAEELLQIKGIGAECSCAQILLVAAVKEESIDGGGKSSVWCHS